jgi:sucrose-6-phosphate hydrolase SacC (GH32 family)
MKNYVFPALASVLVMNSFLAEAQAIRGVPTYDPQGQSPQIQYFKPASDKQFVGDCIPFYDNGTFYLYWLLDEGHHSCLNGLGAHQWCLSTSKDLTNWKHYPIAIGIDEDWEKSICTGSVVKKGKTFYAFYATRRILEDGSVNEQLSYAISEDGISYTKHKPNPFYTSAPGYDKRNFRDPKVIVDKDGKFHLLVSSLKNDHLMNDDAGCLVHLTSSDLKSWAVLDPLLSGVKEVPECSDYFFWHGWYYLIYGQGGDTYYVKSKHPYGPWEYPESQALLEQWVNVAKTAYFNNDRRIVAGWIPSKDGDKDNGSERFGGNIVLREACQLPNGDLATHFPEEVVPKTEKPINLSVVSSENAVINRPDDVVLGDIGNTGCISYNNIPQNCRITMTVTPESVFQEYGIIMRGDNRADGYKLVLNNNYQQVSLYQDATINAVTGLDKTITLDIIIKDDIIDACIDGRRCIVNRLGEKNGKFLWLYARQGKVKFENIKIFPLSK